MVDTTTVKHYEPLDIFSGTAELSTQKYGYRVVSILERMLHELERIAKLGQSKSYQLLTYRWAYEAKELCLFLRDSLLNLLKMEHFSEDGRRTEEELKAFKDELSGRLNEAIDSVKTAHEKYSKSEGVINPQWIHETNPIHFIIEQVQEILDQSKVIYRSRNKLYQIRNTFEDYRTTYQAYMKERVARSAELRGIIEQVQKQITLLPDPIQKPDALKLIAKLEITINTLESLKNLSPYQFIVLEDTSKLKLATHTNGSQLVTKTIDILSEISGWNSFNLVSPLKAIDAKIKIFTERIQIAVFQLLNRLKARLEGNENIEIDKNDVLQITQKLIAEHEDEVIQVCDKKLDELREKLEKNIVPSQLFSKDYNFLPSTTVNQLSNFTEKTALERRYSWSRIKNWLSSKTSMLFSKYSVEEQLTAAGYINNLLSFDPESDTNTLFLKNGFLGSSFTVERTDLMLQVDQHFRLWTQGYGGGLLISGSHHSGRSTILEMIPLVYPEYTSHHLVPGQKLDVKGHKRVMSNDLPETLNFIVKYKGPEPCIVSIDDLEYYSNSAEDAYDIFTSLQQIITKHSKQVYFIVSVHRYLHKKLSRYFAFEPIFSEIIYTDHMATELIEQAVTTRAHAVANNEDISEEPDLLRSSVRKIAKKANNNIGKAMLLWCMTNNGKYSLDASNNQFRQLIKKYKNLLQMLVMHGHLNEPKLRSQLNEIDQVHLKSEIKTLIQLRVLERPGEGLICISPYLLTFIEAILDKS